MEPQINEAKRKLELPMFMLHLYSSFPGHAPPDFILDQ
jgi:hypothetical protein